MRIFVAGCLLGLSMVAGAQQPGLDAVLKQMDAASVGFKSAQADFRRDTFTKVIKETSSQCGMIYFVRKGAATEMGLKVAPSATQACAGEASATANGTRTLAYKGSELQIYEPGTNRLTVFHTGANQTQAESFLTLGFGGSGTDLAKTWNITEQGMETIKDGAKPYNVVKLDLVAKDPNNRNMFSHITIWVEPTLGISLKQQFFSPSGDLFTTFFEHIRYNQKVNEGAFAIKTNKDTQVDRR
ncbi:outer membrane lipoprotein-sorting protein [Granulicella aggregans]|uniref:Outer membrane lipoprotein-sorting protein n=1 Tax=Granulicella aggregans TaxID=474949 RepID=A0A7W7ZDD0_9BACT|nr:outer membrane lipoprotein-sorting protein [Granulicella aggregans]